MEDLKIRSNAVSILVGLALILCMPWNLCKAQQGKLPTESHMVHPNGRFDSWGFSGFGGGGAMFCPAVSPFNVNFAFVACDMTGSFVTYNGGASWRMFNLRNHVNYFVFDPVDSNIVYANAVGLFKSGDRGVTWDLIYPAPKEV